MKLLAKYRKNLFKINQNDTACWNEIKHNKRNNINIVKNSYLRILPATNTILNIFGMKYEKQTHIKGWRKTSLSNHHQNTWRAQEEIFIFVVCVSAKMTPSLISEWWTHIINHTSSPPLTQYCRLRGRIRD